MTNPFRSGFRQIVVVMEITCAAGVAIPIIITAIIAEIMHLRKVEALLFTQAREFFALSPVKTSTIQNGL